MIVTLDTDRLSELRVQNTKKDENKTVEVTTHVGRR